MNEVPRFYRPSPLLRRMLGPLAWRPRLTSGILAGFVLFGLLSAVSTLTWSSCAILSWDLTCLWFTLLILAEMRGQEGEDIAARVAEQDEGRGFILVLVIVAASASLAAVGYELSAAKDHHGWFKALEIAVVIATVALSWITVQIIFALHYAHQYYAPDKSTPAEGDVVGGLQFPGKGSPDYWDFLHFSIVIGVASQTADIAFTSKNLRHIGTVHGLVAFVFNTVVLALTINLVAGLF